MFDLSAVGTAGKVTSVGWTPRDVILYALGVGAGQRDPAAELQFTTENSAGVELQVLPAFGVVMAMTHGRAPKAGKIPPAGILHGEQSFVCHEPLPAAGTASVQATLVGIYDQGRAAHIVTELTLTDTGTGRGLLTTTTTLVVRGAGGFGGERRPGQEWERPGRAPDVVVTAGVRPDQALLYRLSGDRNPLHSDPSFARRAGFDQPILHGMCTLGITSRLLINEVCGGDAARVAGMSGRFSKPVRPGEDLTMKAWTGAAGHRYVVENPAGEVVLDRGWFATYAEPA